MPLIQTDVEMNWPDRIDSEAQLDEVMTRPRSDLVERIRELRSPLLVLGAGGKMGPTLAVLARRAAEAAGHALEVVAVSRFSNAELARWFESRGVKTISCDLMDRAAVARLPETENALYLVGYKFGTSQNPALTWAMNTIAPINVAERYWSARLGVLSTGNVYPFVPVTSSGAVETDLLHPLGEYPNAAIARERLFEYYSQKNGTRVAVIRLNYALDLRYGVLVDIARKVAGGQPIDLTMGYFNAIWQGDANAFILHLLGWAAAPAVVFNLTGPTTLSVRAVAERFGELLGRPVKFTGREAETALLSNTGRVQGLLGEPPIEIDRVIRWTAHWIATGGRLLGKPTRFEVRDGRF